MSQKYIKFNNVSFEYDSASGTLFENLNLHIAAGWSGVVGANGSGKTTLLKLATGLLSPSKGRIDKCQRVVYCSQRTDHPPNQLTEFSDCDTKRARVIRAQLNIGVHWHKRWNTLSHGERKRAQIGVSLWQEPVLLAIDEPTNHLDVEGRALIECALQSFTDIGLLISHDRELLDAICQQVLFVEPPHVICRRGNYTRGKFISDTENKTLKKQRAIKKQAYARLRREAGKRRSKANQADKKRSKRGLSKRDHDAKKKIDAARLSGKDGAHGKRLRQLDGRLAQAQQALKQIKVKKESVLGIWLPGDKSKRDKLFEVPSGSISLGNKKRLYYPDLLLKPDARLGITGPNGSGKSTLLEKLLPLINLGEERIVYIPQEIDRHQSQDILKQAQAMSNLSKGHLMTIVSRLGSCADRMLESVLPSPGEIRKLLLAMGITREPYVIVMDEPTNHMDLASIECLERALFECPGSLILISHDLRFLGRLTQQHWQIYRESEDEYLLKILR